VTGLDAQRPGQRVARAHAARLCERCGRRFEPGRPHQVFCEPACRYAAWQSRQASLLDDPQPLPPVVDQRVPAREARRLCRMSRVVLDLLREGPISNRGLAQSFPPGAAWRTRVSDVRQWLSGQGETVRHRDCGGGLVWYWIEVL